MKSFDHKIILRCIYSRCISKNYPFRRYALTAVGVFAVRCVCVGGGGGGGGGGLWLGGGGWKQRDIFKTRMLQICKALQKSAYRIEKRQHTLEINLAVKTLQMHVSFLLLTAREP